MATGETVLCLGEAIVDLLGERPAPRFAATRSFEPFPGGAMANVAVAVCRAGGRAALGGGTADDDWGRWLRDGLVAEGVDLRWFAAADSGRTPIAFVAFGDAGEPSFAVYGEGIEPGMRAFEPFAGQAVADSAALAFGSNTLVGDRERRVTSRTRELAFDAGLPVCFDPNLRLQRWVGAETAAEECRRAGRGAFLLRANAQEAALLTGRDDPADAARAIARELGVTIAVVTRGAHGAVMRGAAEGEHPGVVVDVVNTMGAGDAFFGALIAGLAADDWDAARAPDHLDAAVRAGAAACTRVGAR